MIDLSDPWEEVRDDDTGHHSFRRYHTKGDRRIGALVALDRADNAWGWWVYGGVRSLLACCGEADLLPLAQAQADEAIRAYGLAR